MNSKNIFLALAAAAIAALIWGFNALVRMRNIVRTSWSDVDIQLKRRADLVPNLVAAVKGYSGFERSVLEDVTRARAGVASPAPDPAARAGAEDALGARLRGLLAVVENYPELKADANFLRLQTELTKLEGTIADARQYYNAAVRDYNTMLESFPLVILARAFRFSKAEFFVVGEAPERDAPGVRLDS